MSLKYIITDLNKKTVNILEHEFKHYLRHNNIKNDDYIINSYNAGLRAYIVSVNVECNNYRSKRNIVKLANTN